MIIAVASQEPYVRSTLALEFGRAPYFIVANTDTDELIVHSNLAWSRRTHAAGICTAESIIRLGVDAVIAQAIGPKALATLRYGYVTVYRHDGGTVEEAIERAKAGQLQAVTAANTQGHSREALT